MPKSHQMTSIQQAELQREIFTVVERHRVRHELAPAAIFDFLVTFAWGYARREGETTEAISNRMRMACESCELSYQKALNAQAQLPGIGGRS
jgi:hypothetical protein